MYIRTLGRIGQGAGLSFTSQMATDSELGISPKQEPQAIERALARGIRDENKLTDLVFFARHPERRGQLLKRHEPMLIQEWLTIRNRLVRPALKRMSAVKHTPKVAPRLKLISNFKIRPPVIRVHENEAARISFVLVGKIRSVACFIFEDPHREGTPFREFIFRDPSPGYKTAIWDGTFRDMRNKPPVTGRYPLWLSVTDQEGRSEDLVGHIRVLNPQKKTVLPRTYSGLTLKSLCFDGSRLVLTDEKGNTVEAAAVSGLKPANPRNKERRDYTQPKHQWKPDKGPLPEGKYSIHQNSVQFPDLRRGKLRFSTGGTAENWGPIRVPLYPTSVTNPITGKRRSGFFLHLDVKNDGTAGCIGVPPGSEGKFNEIMALILHMPNKELPVTVEYGKPCASKP